MSADQFFNETLLSLGAVQKKDRDGQYWELEVGAFVAHFEPFDRHDLKRESRWVGVDCAVGHRDFSRLANVITGDRPNSFTPITWFQKSLDVMSSESSKSAVSQVLSTCVQEIKSLDIDSLIDTYLVERPDRPSMKQILHLAALSWRSNCATLEGYVEAFENGNRLNFVPMINLQMIKKAISLSGDGKAT
jgi:hypothetical protein